MKVPSICVGILLIINPFTHLSPTHARSFTRLLSRFGVAVPERRSQIHRHTDLVADARSVMRVYNGKEAS